MSKLYPPHIEGTLPSFYKTTEKGVVLTIPFSMNRAVSPNEVYGYSLRVKDVINGDELFTTNTYDHSSMTEATFQIEYFNALKFVVGAYYKFQLAYLDKDGNAGYFSTVGVCKCTAMPIINIEGLNLKTNNTHKYSYTGYYCNKEDPTEKVYSYQFILTDKKGKIIADSGKRIHQVEDNAINSYESYDNFNFSFDLEEDEVYLLQYIITTNNNMVVKTPRYRIMQMSMTDMTENIKLQTELNYDEGCINITAVYNDNADLIYVLDTSEEYIDFLDYYNKEYKAIELKEDTYLSGVYYIKNENEEFILDNSEFYDNVKDYFESFYIPAFVDELIYEPNKFYIRQEHFIRGNFLISRSCKDTNYKEWNEMVTIKIEGWGKEFYNENDFTIEQGKYYKYSIQQYNNYGTLSKRIMTDEIFADFEDLFLYDGKRQLKIRYNPKISSFKLDRLMTKTETIGGKHPYIFQNASTHYYEFPIAGLISYSMDENELFMKSKDLGFNENYDSLVREYTYEINNLKNRILNNVHTINRNQLLIDGEESGLYGFSDQNTIHRLKTENDLCYKENNHLREILDKKVEHSKIFKKREYKTHNLESVNIAAERIFKLEVLEWLNNGQPKLFKSPGEGNYIINLMNISLSPEDGLSRMLHTFSSTAYEIADFTYENLIKLNIIERTQLNYNFLLWKTINLAEPKGIDNINNTYILNENYEAVTIHRGDVEYNYYEFLNDVVAYSLSFSGLPPGSVITIDDNDIVIGNTGNYYTESELGFESVLIPENQVYKGNLTYSYYGNIPCEFDLLTNEIIKSHSGVQFIGSGTNIIDELNNSTSIIKDFGYLQFMARDIIEVDLAEEKDWDIKYYLDDSLETQVIFDNINIDSDIYYYIDSSRSDFYYEEVSQFEIGKTYYKNNRYGINPIYIGEPNTEFKYHRTVDETFYLQNTDDLININNNYYPLYKYLTNKIIIDNDVVYLSDPETEDSFTYINIYKDKYWNKYYIDETIRNNISDSFYELLLSYGFELLSFDIMLNDNNIKVGPKIKHIKQGKQFEKSEEYQYIKYTNQINSNQEFEKIKDKYGKLYKYELGQYIEISNYDPLNTNNYYWLKDYNYFIFYLTKDCQHQKLDITNENCEQYYILDSIDSQPDYSIENVFVKKGEFIFNNLTLGNAVVLNCAYQTIDYTYAIEDFTSLDNKYFDGKLSYLKEQVDFYYNIMNGKADELYDFNNLSLTDLDGIIEYYKNQLLEDISSINQDYETNIGDVATTINNYSKFLNVYNNYLSGKITTLTEFKEALEDNGKLIRIIESLINEKLLLEDYAKQQYLKYLKEYTIRVEQLLQIYRDKEGNV